ncbi:diacylglycerol kinase [Affinibrenneria salicis]|uniref:Diacylglycerol kinase n=1 Tax=Affinibrenneria salicis TaxID=2590031 RepID=A0A5J5G6H7_9GAMM|nr:diacylglycerol kinase [Affinibrenneria salicis]KAA9002836.1 diacylglycerol kinase [Affinibrenneria salicis]KAA9002877.1 diacylglycerol kinase [Affinibrenneria salicis]
MNKATGLTRIIKATGYSLQGLRLAWRYEAAFRQEVLLLIAAVAVALWLDVSVVERLLLILSVALIVLMELLNSAIEAVVDRIGMERHELSGRAKDIGSAAVFVAILLALVVWLSILWSNFA